MIWLGRLDWLRREFAQAPMLAGSHFTGELDGASTWPPAGTHWQSDAASDTTGSAQPAPDASAPRHFTLSGTPALTSDLVRLEDRPDAGDRPAVVVFATARADERRRLAMYSGSAATLVIAVAALSGRLEASLAVLWLLVFGLVSIVETAVYFRMPARSVRLDRERRLVVVCHRHWPWPPRREEIAWDDVAGIVPRPAGRICGDERLRVELRFVSGRIEPLFEHTGRLEDSAAWRAAHALRIDRQRGD